MERALESASLKPLSLLALVVVGISNAHDPVFGLQMPLPGVRIAGHISPVMVGDHVQYQGLRAIVDDLVRLPGGQIT